MSITFCIISAAVLAVIILTACFFLRKKKQGVQLPLTLNECKTIVDRALTSLNCKPDWSDMDYGYSASYIYQAGFFRIRIDKDCRYLNLAYMYMFETPLSNIDMVRELCNVFTKRSCNEKVVYSVNGEKNVINVHILSTFIPEREGTDDILQQEMRSIFGCRNMFYNEFGKMQNDMAHANLRDLEKEAAEWSRKNFLVHEHELINTPKGMRFRENSYDHLMLTSFMCGVLSDDTVKIVSVLVCLPDGGNVKITDAKEIMSYHISDPIIRDGRMIRSSATLVVEYNDDVLPGFTRTAVVHINYEGGGRRAMYYRVSLMQVPMSAEDIHNSPTVRSFTVAYDTNDKKQNYFEFLYLWKEAKEKKNEAKELTAEEKLISYTDDENNAYRMFMGRKLFMEHRYYEAAPYLENVYCYMSGKFSELSDYDIASFYEVCFMLGTAYCDMNDYGRALPYLATTLDSEQVGIPLIDAIRYKKEYVNCLVNSGDYRAMKYVFELINTIVNTQKFHELSYHWNDFLNFLKRRYIQILINNSFLDDAEIELKEMLNDPENKDYALNELAYLQKNRKKNNK